MQSIEVLDLDSVAQRPDGKAYLGLLVRRLVYATIAKDRPILQFNSGQTNNNSGWDGWVEVSYVDCGITKTHRSVWELSTEKTFKTKFENDFREAETKALPSGWNSSDVIYVGLTMRNVTHDALGRIKKWAADNSGTRTWAGLVFMAADDLAQWLEKIPSVADWASEEFKVGKKQFGKALDHWFRNWAEQTDPAVIAALLLCGKNIPELTKAFRVDGDAVIDLQADSLQEAVALIYCGVKSLPEAEAEMILAGALVVEDEKSAASLAEQIAPPSQLGTVILCPPATAHAVPLARKGYRVIKALARTIDAGGVLTFERANVQEFAEVLQKMGLSQSEAEAQARAVGCSVTIWHIRNLHRNHAQLPLPEWAHSGNMDAIVAAVFACSWDERSVPDVNVVQSLSGMDAGAFSSALRRYSTGHAPLLELIGTSRIVIAPTAAFELILGHISWQQVQRLTEVCKEIFQVVEPGVQEHWEGEKAEGRIINKSDELSSELRSGLAETLLRVAVFGDQLVKSGSLGGFASGQDFVDSVIANIPGLQNDGRVIASLNRQLPYLVEAAPNPLLGALESLIQGAPDQIRLLLADEVGIFGRSFHTGVLWGLEAMAWSPEWLSRVSRVLADLHSLDTPSTLSNRPLNSLREIYLAWHPGTSATPIQRAEVLRSLGEMVPEVTWQLLLKLLPDSRSVSTQTHKPKWRQLGQVSRQSMKRMDVIDAYGLYIGLTLDLASRNGDRLSALVRHYPEFSPEHRLRLEAAWEELIAMKQSEEAMQKLWVALVKLCNHHSAFQETSWAMPEETVLRLRAVAESIPLEDALLKSKWLFDDQMPELGKRSKDYDLRGEELTQLRRNALQEIIASRGWDGINQLAITARYQYIVGLELGGMNLKRDAVLRIASRWAHDEEHDLRLPLRSLSTARAEHDGQWIVHALELARKENWTPKNVASLVLDFPDTTSTFDLIDLELNEAERSFYWTNRYAYLRIQGVDLTMFERASRTMLRYGRAAELIDSNWQSLPKLGSSFLLQVLDAFIQSPPSAEQAQRLSSFEHDIQYLFDWLLKQENADLEGIAKREYPLLPLLTSHGLERRKLALHDLLSSSPDLFVSAVCDLYKPSSQAERDLSGKSLEEVRARANAAFELLQSFRMPPGLKDGHIDWLTLETWVSNARNLLIQFDRQAIGEQEIGKLLFHCIKTDPVHFPPPPLSKLLEKWHSKDIEAGMSIECFNDRGITSRGMLDGGEQERNLEKRWRAYAAAVAPRWPRSRALCLHIAEYWRRQAKAEDEDAKRERVRHSR